MRPIVLLLAILIISAAGCQRISERRGSDSMCAQHGIELEEETVPIRYGLYALPPYDLRDYLEAERVAFPHARPPEHERGGCLFVVGHSPTHARISFCPRCRAAERAWVSAHGG